MAAMTGEKLHLTTDGNWFELRAPSLGGKRSPAVFLDRDGILIEDKGYVGKAEDVALCEGACELLDAVAARGWRAIIVTNQSGIGRGYYGWPEFARVQAAMFDRLGAAGAVIEAVLACPYFPDHPWRKPAPGMIVAAGKRLPIDHARSWMIGDKDTDIACASAARLAGGILVRRAEEGSKPPAKLRRSFRALAVASVSEATTLLSTLS